MILALPFVDICVDGDRYLRFRYYIWWLFDVCIISDGFKTDDYMQSLPTLAKAKQSKVHTDCHQQETEMDPTNREGLSNVTHDGVVVMARDRDDDGHNK